MTDKPTTDPNSFEHLIEPPYDLERGEELNRLAGEHDPAFAKKREQGRTEAAKAKKGGHDANR
jgi:hypothetical protein